MSEIFDFEFSLTSVSGDEPAQVVVFFTGTERIDETQITYALQQRLSEYILPDHVTFLVPECYKTWIEEQCADPSTPVAIALQRRGKGSTPSYGFSYFNEHGVITTYVCVSGAPRDIDKLIPEGVGKLIQAGMKKLVKCTSVLTKAPAGFLFSKPSSRSSNYFIRAENLLTEALHSHFLAFACLGVIGEASKDGMGVPVVIYLDTMAFLPVALSIQLFQAKLNKQTINTIKSFHSHEGLKDGPLPNGDSSLCLISASTNCGLAEDWVKINRAPPSRVATFLSFLPKSDWCTVLHSIEKPEDFESPAEAESNESRQKIRIHGERFVAQHTETRLLNISMDHLPGGLQNKFYSFMGKGLFKCYSQIPERERQRTIYVEKEKLVATEEFANWFQQALIEECPASTSLVIYDNDNASEQMAIRAIEYLEHKGLSCQKVNASKFDPQDKFTGSVLIVAAAAERGSVLLSVSRRLRSAQASGTRVYLVGALFGRSYELMRELSINLTQPPKGSRRYSFKTYLEIPASSLTCNNHWSQEHKILSQLISFDYKGISASTRDRVKAFDSSISTGLSDQAFWQSSYTKTEMKLSNGFAFVDNTRDVVVATCVDVFLTILWILQNARENAKIKDAKRLESGELQQVLLTPEIFSRYDDGIIQAAFLRAAQPTELDYSAHETYSTSMADIILRVVKGYGHERGDAAMEFIIALAIGKIRLHKEVDKKLRANIHGILDSKVTEIGPLLGDIKTPI